MQKSASFVSFSDSRVASPGPARSRAPASTINMGPQAGSCNLKVGESADHIRGFDQQMSQEQLGGQGGSTRE